MSRKARDTPSGLFCINKDKTREDLDKDEKVMESNKKRTLSPRQLQVLPHLLESPSYEAAARQSGISAKQIYEWLKEPLFSKELQRQRNELFRRSIEALKAASRKAIQTMIDLLDEKDARIRLSASEKVLSNALKAIEVLEIDERLERLENQIERVHHFQDVR